MPGANDCAYDYSIVIPVYFNEGCLTETMTSVKKEVIDKHPDLSCEVILVDDGSEDGSLNELLRIQKENPKLVKIIQLTRNFGQPFARLAGLSHARGKCVVSMSADGQDPATLINEMLTAHRQDQYEIVVCTRRGRDESLYRVMTSKLFYTIIRKLSFPNMPKGGFDYILMGRRALDVLLENREAHPFIQGQILWLGFKIKFIEYQRLSRKIGKSRWTFGKKLTYLIDGVMGYSFLPLRFISVIGILVALLGFFWVLRIFVLFMIHGNPIKGWSPLMIAILIIGGIQIFMLGIVGEYLWRVLAQVRNRDPYIIEKIYDDS